ncbi:hypothetical protein Tco_1084058 [Tanacetum coccineum]
MGSLSYPVENESPVEEVAPVKAMKVSKRHQKAKMTINKGKAINMRGFWRAALDYFENEMGERPEDTMSSPPNGKIVDFWMQSVMAQCVETASPKPLTPSQMQGDDVTRRLDDVSLCRSKEALRRFDGLTASQNASDAVRAQFLYIQTLCFHNSCVELERAIVQTLLTNFKEYEAQYEHDITFKSCWRILKDHAAWKDIEMPLFYKQQNKGSKKTKTVTPPNWVVAE